MKRTDVDWMAVRTDYEDLTLPITDLLAKHAISESTLYDRIRKQGWPNRQPAKPVTRTALIERLYRLLEGQIRQLETELRGAGDKQVALLGALTRNLEKLTEMERKERGEKARTPKRKADISALRAKLARRIDEINNG